MGTRLDRLDYRFWALTCGGLLAALAVLQLVAVSLTPADRVFSGFLFDAHDGWSYVAWSRAFAGGEVLADVPTALESRQGGFFNLVWFLVGRGMALTGLPFLFWWHLLGTLAVAGLYLALLAFMREFLADRRAAWTGYLMAGFGTGLGWIAVPFPALFSFGGWKPNDIVQGDGFPIYCAWTFPHITFSFALLVLIYLAAVRGLLEGRWPWSLAGCAAALVLGFSHPYHLVSVGAVLVCWMAVLLLRHGRPILSRLLHPAVIVASMLPGVFFYWRMVYDTPAFSFWREATENRSGGVLYFLLGFAPFILLALVGYRGVLPPGRFSDRYLLAATWVPVQFLAHFSWPLVFFDARLGEGIILPLAVLGSWGFFDLLRRRAGWDRVCPDPDERRLAGAQEEGDRKNLCRPPGRKLAMVMAGLVAALLPSTVLLVANQLRVVSTGRGWFEAALDTGATVFRDDLSVLRSAGRLVPAGSLVLASPPVGVLLPAFADVRVLVGHTSQTPDREKRFAMIRRFYDEGTPPEERRRVLLEAGARFVWWSEVERSYGGPSPGEMPFLRPVARKGETVLYEVME